MNKIKVMSVFGTRPEAIKMAPLVHALNENPEIEPVCCVTAQHREMLDSVLNIFDIKPDYDLNIMSPKQTLADITTKSINGLDDVYKKVKPDLVLVHGDTSTAFAAALTAFYHKIKVGHVEAGLRTFDKYSPYPEEINRRLLGAVSDFHFCPTGNNANNLRREGIERGIYITGNTVIDAIRKTVKPEYRFFSDELKALDLNKYRTILLTAHRRENYGTPLENIMNAVKDLVNEFPDMQVIYPVHLSPAVYDTAHRILDGVPRVHLLSPIDVGDMHNLMARSYLILTDSGGLQEEAPSLGKPVLVLRNETERPEAVEAGTVRVIGVEREDIFNNTAKLLISGDEYDKMSHAVNPYGDGMASNRIVQAILHELLRLPPPADYR